MVCAAVGQAVGSLAGRHLRQAARRARPAAPLRQRRRRRPRRRHRPRALLGRRRRPPLPPRQTELRHYAQDSAILSRLNEELPPHRLIDTLAQIDPFSALAGPAAGVEAPDPAVLDSPGVSSSALSVVRVVGNACGLGIEGSGWIAGNGLVVTNAHVVAGIDTPHVDRNDGALLDAQVVSFDKTQRRRRPPRRRAPRARRCSSATPRRAHPAACSATRATAPTPRRPSASAASCRSSAATRTATSPSAAR